MLCAFMDHREAMAYVKRRRCLVDFASQLPGLRSFEDALVLHAGVVNRCTFG